MRGRLAAGEISAPDVESRSERNAGGWSVWLHRIVLLMIQLGSAFCGGMLIKSEPSSLSCCKTQRRC